MIFHFVCLQNFHEVGEHWVYDRPLQKRLRNPSPVSSGSHTPSSQSRTQRFSHTQQLESDPVISVSISSTLHEELPPVILDYNYMYLLHKSKHQCVEDGITRDLREGSQRGCDIHCNVDFHFIFLFSVTTRMFNKECYGHRDSCINNKKIAPVEKTVCSNLI